MRHLLLTICVLSATLITAQVSGTIEYKMDIKMDFSGEGFEALEGIDLSDMLPESTSSYKTLNFDGPVTTYTNSGKTESEDTTMESDDGSIQMVFQTSEDESILHLDHKTKKSTEQTSFMGKTFLITQDLEAPKWKITNEKVKYLDYECTKAITEGEIDKEGNPKEVIAWFTMQIPASVGPDSYYGLPGAILMLSIDGEKTQIRATEVSLTKPDTKSLEKPTKGKKVTAEEYVELIRVRTEEMRENAGGGTFIEIRG